MRGFSVLALAGGLCLTLAAGLFIYQNQPAVPVLSPYQQAEAELLRIFETQGLVPALQALSAIANGPNDKLVAQCHGLAHELGHQAVHQMGFQAAFRFQDDICGSGYLHGVVEEKFEDVAPALLPWTVLNTCPKDDARCFHGLGHGIMVATDNNIPRSIKLCRTLPTGFPRIQCAEGVFMEHFAAESSHASPTLDLADIYAKCRDQRDPERAVCTFYAPRAWLKANNFDYTKAIQWCRDTAGVSKNECIRGVGSAAMKYQIATPDVALKTCEPLRGIERNMCVSGLVSYRIVHFADPERGQEFCAHLTAKDQVICDNTVHAAEPFYGE
jgi:hypothetical protein